MIWILILHYQINTLELQFNLEEEEKKKNLSAKEKLLLYCQNLTKGYPVKVDNLTTHFSDGSVLACMIHAKKPNTINPRKIIACQDKLLNVQETMAILEKEFDVPHVIAPENVTEEPDEKAMMTFLSYFIQGLEKFPTVKFGLDDENEEEELLDEPTQVHSAPPETPTVDIVPRRVLNLGKGENSSSDAYFYKSENAWKAVSWKDFSGEVFSIARSLVSVGIAKSDRVAIMGANASSWTISYLAAQTIGAIPIGIYETCSVSSAKYVLEHSEATILFVFREAEFKKILEIRSQLPNLKRIVLFKETGETGSDGNSILSWNQFIQLGESTQESQVMDILSQIQEEDEATYIYTSGTTGHPKAVILTHANLNWVSREVIKMHNITSQDFSLSYLPLSHIAEQVFTILLPASNGSKIYYCEGTLKILDNLKEIQPTLVFAVPRVWEKMYTGLSTKVPFSQLEKVPKETKTQLLTAVGLSRARIPCVGAAPIDLSILKYFEALGLNIYEVYGQSEDCGPTTFNTEKEFRLGSAGKPFPGLEVKIAEDGEVLVKGPTVFKGYFKDNEATESTLKDGWLYSGDLGKFDNDGFLFITGRKKDIM